MADENVLVAEPLAERGSRPAGRLRSGGRVPAIVYGLGGPSVAVTVNSHDLDRILSHGANTLITLHVDGDQQMTLVRQIQRHATRGQLVHVDFVRVRADVAVAAEVPLHLLGEPVGVRNGGLLEQLIFQLHVEARPQDIPHSIDADVSHLDIGDQLRLSEIAIPPRVECSLDAETLVAQVVAPRVAELPEEGEVPEGEVPEGEAAEAAEGEARGAEGAPESSE